MKLFATSLVFSQPHVLEIQVNGNMSNKRQKTGGEPTISDLNELVVSKNRQHNKRIAEQKTLIAELNTIIVRKYRQYQRDMQLLQRGLSGLSDQLLIKILKIPVINLIQARTATIATIKYYQKGSCNKHILNEEKRKTSLYKTHA